LVEGAGASGAQKCFQFGERHLDRVEIGTIRGRKRSDAPAAAMVVATSTS
jgi:hypothetical protein